MSAARTPYDVVLTAAISPELRPALIAAKRAQIDWVLELLDAHEHGRAPDISVSLAAAQAKQTYARELDRCVAVRFPSSVRTQHRS